MSDNTPQGTPDVPPAPAPGHPAPASHAPYAAAPGAYPPPSGYSAPGYPQQPYGYGQAAPYPYQTGAKTNALAITSLVASIAAFVVLPFIASIVAVITGHIALKQLRTSGENGRGLALAGVIVGWVGVGLGLLFTIVIVIAIAATIGAGSAYTSYS